MKLNRAKAGSVTTGEKIPYKCKMNSYWRIKTIEMQLYIGFFLEVLKISPGSGIGTGVIMERLPYQCNIYILEKCGVSQLWNRSYGFRNRNQGRPAWEENS